MTGFEKKIVAEQAAALAQDLMKKKPEEVERQLKEVGLEMDAESKAAFLAGAYVAYYHSLITES